MFDTITGLPIHPLVVHAVIVLLPLACLGAVLVAAKPSWNRSWGWVVLACSFIALGSAFVAKESGEKLESRVGRPWNHAEWGERLPIAAFGLFVLLAVLWWFDRKQRDGRTVLTKVVAVLVVLAAAVTLVLTVKVGHSGATAVWGPVIESTTVGSAESG